VAGEFHPADQPCQRSRSVNHCGATRYSRSGAERCRFVVALPEFIERARKAQLDDQDVDGVMAALLK
jgi:hypothetical protein